jgi:hypothetical protein
MRHTNAVFLPFVDFRVVIQCRHQLQAGRREQIFFSQYAPAQRAVLSQRCKTLCSYGFLSS